MFLRLLGQGCRHKEIARQSNIRPRTAKQHPAYAIFARGHQARPQARHSSHGSPRKGATMQSPRHGLTVKERVVAAPVWEGLTHRDIADRIHTSEQVEKTICALLSTSWARGAAWSWLYRSRAMAGRDGRVRSSRAKARSRQESRGAPRDLRIQLGQTQRSFLAGIPRNGRMICSFCRTVH